MQSQDFRGIDFDDDDLFIDDASMWSYFPYMVDAIEGGYIVGDYLYTEGKRRVRKAMTRRMMDEMVKRFKEREEERRKQKE